jgi:hypothetical protein
MTPVVGAVGGSVQPKTGKKSTALQRKVLSLGVPQELGVQLNLRGAGRHRTISRFAWFVEPSE